MRSLVGRLAVLALVVSPAVAFAQVTPQQKVIPPRPKPFLAPGDSLPPNIFISPDTATVGSPQLPMTVSFGDACGFSTSPSITLNGVNVTSSFTFQTTGTSGPQCTGYSQTATGTITLRPGYDTLTAFVQNLNHLSPRGGDTGTYIYNPPVHRLRITVAAGATHGTASSRVSVPFTVTNIGNVIDTVYTKNHCNGAALSPPTHCFTSPDSAFGLPPGGTYSGTAFVDLGTTLGSTGRLETIAYERAHAGVTDTAYTDITIQNPSGPGVVLNTVTPDVTRPRNKCLTIEIQPGVAYQCGDLRVVHNLPAIRTYDKGRTPALIYNSNMAIGVYAVGALVTFNSSMGTPDTVKATITDSATGATIGQNTWLGSYWVNGATQRVTVRANQLGNESGGRWVYTFTATAVYNSQHTTQSYSATGAQISVSQATGPGFMTTLAGRESLVIPQWTGATPWNSTKPLFWQNSEGDTRQYNAVPNDSLVWASVGVDRPDTIKSFNGPTLYGLYRYAEHGAVVHFDPHGPELGVTDRLGHQTLIVDTALTHGPNSYKVVVPTPSGGVPYIFAFGGSGHPIDSIIAPTVNGQSRTVRVKFDTLSLYKDTIIDPDGSFVVYSWLNGQPHLPGYDLMTSYRDKHGTVTAFYYDSAFKLIKAVVDTAVLKLTWTFTPAESRGYTTPVAPDSAYTLVAGPRANSGGDSLDISRYWVDQWGEPFRIRDPHGYEVELTRGNSTYPSLVTYARYQNGRVVTATYDPRGNFQTETDSTLIVNDTAATTQYTFDQHWDFVTQIVQPMGDQVNAAYDATYGNLLWLQPGTSTSTRINFTYWPSTAAGSNLRATSTLPVESPSSDSEYYDATLGNASATVTAKGFKIVTLTDAIGRVIRTATPIDSLNVSSATDTTHHKWRIDSLAYDNMGRVVLKKSYGPPDTSNFNPSYSTEAYGKLITAAETTLVTTVYDPRFNGLPRSITRQALPDINNIGQATTWFDYDSVGRLQKQWFPDSTEEFFTYDAEGDLIGKVTRRGDELAFYYDALGKQIKRVLPRESYPQTPFSIGPSNFQTPIYPNCGLGYCISGEVATFRYDAVGHLVEADNQDATVTRQYSQNGLLAADTLRIRSYTNLGDFTQHVYPIGYTYNRDGHLATVVHPTNVAPIVGGVSKNVQQYAYDGLGRMATATDVNGNTFTFGYDNDSRINHISSTQFGLSQRFGFDLDGRLITRLDSTADATTVSGTGTHVLHQDAYHYDARANVLEMDAVQEASHNRYSALGTMVRGIIVPNSGPVKYAYDLDEEIYVPDALGNVQTKWETTCPTCDSLSNAQVLVYTPKTARLDSATYHTTPRISPEQFHLQKYTYDVAGNRQLSIFEDSPDDIHANEGVGYYYYDALDRMRAFDRQSCYFDNGIPGCAASEENLPVSEETRFEDYYYDALGRRVMMRSRDDILKPCLVNATQTHPGCFGSIERTVYDGNTVLYDIRMPGDDSVSAVELERDTGGVSTYVGHDFLTPYGRVAYLHGIDLDFPLSITRIGSDSSWPGPVAVAPLANWRKAYDNGLFTQPNAGSQFLCKTYANGTNGETCFWVTWPAPRYGYWRQDGNSGANAANMAPDPWMGSLVTGSRDVSNLLHLRNRYFDPQSQTFTQEDPIGLAGGLNAYGFAHGDPVNYSDPFGLCPIEKDGIPCAGVYALAGLIGGAATGALVGGTVGSIVPIAGNLVGGGGGAVTGGFLGFGAGLLVGAARDVGSILGVAARSEEAAKEPPLPESVDDKGKVHGDLPSHVPDDASVGDLLDARDALQTSIGTRQAESQRLGEESGHRERLRRERDLLRQVDDRLRQLVGP